MAIIFLKKQYPDFMAVPEQLLESVQRDVRIYEDYLKKVADAVLDEHISEYPIFVVHREEHINLGRPIIFADQMEMDWSVNASLIEEFVKKRIINPIKVAEFKRVYKNPRQYVCLFVVIGDGEANFAFYPYHSPTISKN